MGFLQQPQCIPGWSVHLWPQHRPRDEAAGTRPLQVHWGKWGVGGVCMLGRRGEGKRGMQGAAWRSSGVEHSTAPLWS